MNTYRKRGKQRSIFIALSLFGLGIFALFAAPLPASAVSSQELFDYWANIFSNCPRQENSSLQIELLAKAQTDGCFYGIGDPGNQYLAKTCENGTWKVNGGQLWGLAKSGNKLWIGTRANPICVTMGVLGGTVPKLTDFTVCEFGEGPWSPQIPERYGDWRPPSIYVYNLDTSTFTRKAFLMPGSMGGIPLIQGLRGAGALNGIVFLAGLSAGLDGQTSAVILFAFNSETEKFLGWHKLKDSAGIDYTNTRKWLVFNSHLYASILAEEGGRILRWLGNVDAIKCGDYTTLWDFEEVGVMHQAPSNIAVYDGKRLAVGTRPFGSKRILRGGEIWLSPEFDDHLTAVDAPNWKRVWTATDYEPDSATAVASAIGDLRFFDGYLWWGCETSPGLAFGIHKAIYKKAIPNYPSEEEDLAAFYGTWRPTPIFRGRNLGDPNEKIDIVYGFSALPKFTFTAEDKSGKWQLVPNRMGGKAPLQGQGGFCNWYQVQTCSMAVYNNQLFVGTTEYSHRILQGLLPILSDFPQPQSPEESLWGAELWRFPDADSPAIAESTSGIGNYLNTSVRNMISDDALYIGTGNTNNLATDTDDDIPEGGWELLKLK